MPHTEAKVIGRGRRKALRWAGGLAAIVLGAVAVAAPFVRGGGGDRAVIGTQFGEFTASHETMAALKWFSDRGRSNGFRSNADGELTHARLWLEPAAGVELPSGEFEAEFIRFNDDGEVVHVEHAAADAPSCTMLWVQDTSNPRYWYASCVGACPAPDERCTLFIDLGTLELACGCLP